MTTINVTCLTLMGNVSLIFSMSNMNTITENTLKRLEATHGKKAQESVKPRLKAFYGWSKNQ